MAYDTQTCGDGPAPLVECTITANIHTGSLAGDLLTATELACNLLGRPARVEAGADPGVWLVELNPDELAELNAAGRFMRVSESTCLAAELPLRRERRLALERIWDQPA